MRDIAIHESGAEIDLVEPTLDQEILLRMMLADRDAHRGTRKGVLRCATHDAPLYLQMRSGVVYACHWPGTSAEPHRVSLMSAEHRIQVDYADRAASRAGLSTAREVSLPTHVRPDLVVAGTTAVEVQRSHLAVAHAKARTTKAINGGMAVSLWLSDKEPQYQPKWMYQVPSATVFARDWSTPPPLGSATVTGGVRELVSQPCRPPYRTQCPETKRNWCGKQHIIHLPLRGVSLDDLIVGVANEEFIPAVVRNDVLIARKEEVERFGLGWLTPPSATAPAPRMSPERIECHAQTVVLAAPVRQTSVARIAPADPLPIKPIDPKASSWRCAVCSVRGTETTEELAEGAFWRHYAYRHRNSTKKAVKIK